MWCHWFWPLPWTKGYIFVKKLMMPISFFPQQLVFHMIHTKRSLPPPLRELVCTVDLLVSNLLSFPVSSKACPLRMKNVSTRRVWKLNWWLSFSIVPDLRSYSKLLQNLRTMTTTLKCWSGFMSLHTYILFLVCYWSLNEVWFPIEHTFNSINYSVAIN